MNSFSARLAISFTFAIASASATAGDELEARQEMSPEPEQHEQSSARDPFWPVGYSPAGEAPESNDTYESVERRVRDEREMNRLWNEAKAQVNTSGFSRMGREGYMAVVNNRIMRKGDTVRIDHEGLVFRWRIDEISNAGVKLTRAGVDEPENGGT